MEYDRQTEAMEHWTKVGTEWLFLDALVRMKLLEKYPDFFGPIQNASMSSVTYYTDIISAVSSWSANEMDTLQQDTLSASPHLARAVKNLATMIDDKVFSSL